MRKELLLLAVVALSGCKEDASEQRPALESLTNSFLYEYILEDCGQYLSAVNEFIKEDSEHREELGRQIVTTTIWLHGYSSGRFKEAMPDQQRYTIALSESARSYCENHAPTESVLGFFDDSLLKWRAIQTEK